jgi:hypothetical protein
MTNREFIRRLKKARRYFETQAITVPSGLRYACAMQGIYFDRDKYAKPNAVFGEGKFCEGCSWLYFRTQDDFPDTRTAALAVIDNSIAALEKA